MFDVKTIRNIHIEDFKNLFREHKVRRWSVKLNEGETTALKYNVIRRIIKEETSSTEGRLTREQIDKFLWDQLYYSLNNYHFLYRYNNIAITDEMSSSDVDLFFREYEELKYNQNILDWTVDNNDSINICTTRLELSENNTPKAIHILSRLDTISMNYGNTHVFCGITIDLHNKLILLKFDLKQLDGMQQETLKVIKSLIEALKGVGNVGQQFASLDLNIIQLQENEVISTIYKLFSEMSDEAEQLLDNEVEESNVQKINDFLVDLGLTEIKKEYIEQIKAVIYQDISSRMEDQLFNKGWVFRFQFREGDHTKASSKQEKRQPVYSTKTFWQLKELIHKEKEMYEAGFHWNLNETPGDKQFVNVRLEYKNGTMILHYYYNMRNDRKEKEEYVVRKVSRYLRKNRM